MRIPLDPASEVPLFRQLEAALRRDVTAGRLPAGARLPSTRALAAALGVSRLTVEAAFAELRADGLVVGQPGSGTYVERLPPMPPPARGPEAAWPGWQRRLPRALTGAEGPGTPPAPAGAIRLDLGIGDPGLFPVEEFRAELQRTLRRGGAEALGYGDPAGHPPLRRAIAQVLTAQGIPARPECLLVTAGSQRAIGLVTTLLARPGDAVVVERPTYPGALELFRARGLRVVGAPTDDLGLRVDALEPLLSRHRPRLLYVIPNFQNPTGACLPASRRRALLALAARHGVPIVEDDFVGDLRYEGRAQPALKALDPAGHVVYLSTFSKMLMPGLRVGFVLADGPVVARLAHLHRLEELAGCLPIQRALAGFVDIGRYRAHLRRACRTYRGRRDAMVAAAARHLGGEVAWLAPQGGLFLWLRLPPGCDAAALLPRAAASGVVFAPGEAFFPAPAEGRRFARLCFAGHEPDVLEEALRRLGSALRAHRGAAGTGRRPGVTPGGGRRRS
ncbi:MAG: PLP-dependent aminotransferase family protein [Anaeromyxobacteraceae bacterium]|nr:PLP-dependent aminotransferase family protein [Anaeromyxobacteraceae bacterium]